MCVIDMLQPTIAPFSGCYQNICSSHFVRQISAAMSDLADRVNSAAFELWKKVDGFYQQVDDLFLHVRKSISGFIKGALSSVTARFVLYSLNELTTDEEHKERAESVLSALNLQGSDANAHSFQISDHCSLSAVSIIHPREKNPDQQTIVYFPTNFEIWQSAINFIKTLHLETGANLHALNYRGTGGSSGFPQSDDTLIQDGVSFVRKLLQDGVQAKKIALFGGDVGGATATCIAAILAREGIIVDVISVRSFTSLADMIRHICPIAQDFAIQFAHVSGWKYNVLQALKELRGRFIYAIGDQDPVVPPSIHIKTAITNSPPGSLQLKEITEIRMDEGEFVVEFPQLAEDPDCNPHVRPFTKREQAELVAAIKKLWQETSGDIS